MTTTNTIGAVGRVHKEVKITEADKENAKVRLAELNELPFKSAWDMHLIRVYTNVINAK